MNPFSKTITFSEKKPNHFYCIKENDTYLKVDNPKKGDIVYEVPTISGGTEEETKKLLLEIPIPLCQKHQHDGNPFGVETCNGWKYIAIPTPLGSLRCRECYDELFLPQPYLSYANLYSANLRYANLRSANLSYANLSSANLRFADLSYANLRFANLRSVDLSYVDLYSADLSFANLSSADLHSADLHSADLHSADLHSADLRYADLHSADLSYANLSSADLSSADLRYADLSYADLSFADLSFADLSFADLRYVDLRSAKNINKSINLDKAYWNKFTLIDAQFKKLLTKEKFLDGF